MWHTHLLIPRAYWYDVGFLMNASPPMHKLLPLDARVEFVYEPHKSSASDLWLEEFQEPLQNLVAPRKTQKIVAKGMTGI